MKTKSSALLLLGVLALSACGQQSATPVTSKPTTPTATPGKSLGLYELQVNGLGKQATATVQRAGSNLTAQAAEINGLTFTPAGMVNLRDPQTHINHMTASFTVTNNTGAAIQVPTYIPVDTDGAYATDGATPFRNVKTNTGAPASTAGMHIEQSYQTSGAVIQVDPAATPLVSNLDTGTLQLTLPAGTTAPGISHNGWQTTTLAPGASQVVNFGAAVPFQGSDIGPSDAFSFSLVFAVADNPGTIAGLTNIASVQGNTPTTNVASPLNAQSVTIEGIVTSVLPGLSGFFVQQAGIDADADATTSDGVFVYCGANCPALSAGTRVRVTGTVAEYNGATQITAPTITTLASGLPVPDAVALTLPLDKTQMERYEGMRVTFPETLTVTNNYTYGRYGQLDLSNAGRMFLPTNGNASTTPQSFITLDDGLSAQNPLNLNFLSSENTRRTGDTVTGLTGIWHTIANAAMVEPEGTVNFTDANSRAANAQPHDVGGTLRIGGANVLNYFTDLDADYSGVNRGANTAAELKRQRDKMANTLSGLNADVLTLMEVENNGDTALNDVVAALNEKVGAGTYAAISTGKIGTDAIHVAIIYKPAKVTPIGAPMIDTNSVFSRPPVAQTFRDRTTNGIFSVVANHLKSKGSCPTSGDVDTGQGCWNQLRVQQATQILNFVNTIKTQSGDGDVILLGDFNAYGAEDPIKTLQNGGFESLNLRIPAEDRYSYQFGGLFGYLDHALASQNLSSQVTGITEWHVNSDEPTIADYNTEYKAIPECVTGAGGSANTCQGKDLYSSTNPFRASDHDPVLVGLNLTPDAGTTPTNPVTSLTTDNTNVDVSYLGRTITLTTATQNYTGSDLTVSINSSPYVMATPSATTVSPNGTFTVKLNVPADAASGPYPVTITTTGDNGLTASTTIYVTISSDSSTPTGSLNHLLISQVYGAGGNSGAAYTNDFIEIFNPTHNTINLANYSVQYASATGTSWQVTPLTNFNLAPGQYYLVQEAKGTAGTVTPTPDATGTIAMAGAAGQVALVESTTKITSKTDAVVRDYMSYSGLTSTTSASRSNTCTDTDAASDFANGAVNARNSSSAIITCN